MALLAIRMAVVAAIVASVLVVVARAGPLVGAMLVTLPVSAGPAYVFLALDHGPEFVSQAAIGSILAVSANSAFIVAHNLGTRIVGTIGSLLAAMLAFAVSLAAMHAFSWTLSGAVIVGTLLFFAGIVATRRTRREAVAFAMPSRRIDIVVRAVAVMAVVAAVTIFGEIAGPRVAGYAALLPVVFMSMIVVVQPRVGGGALAGLFAHAIFGVLGYVPAFAVVSLAAAPLGVWWALSLGLATSIGWNAAVIVLRRAGWLRV